MGFFTGAGSGAGAVVAGNVGSGVLVVTWPEVPDADGATTNATARLNATTSAPPATHRARDIRSPASFTPAFLIFPGSSLKHVL